MSENRTLKPGDPDHPAEQIRRATGRPAPSGKAVFHVRITVAGDAPPSIPLLEATIVERLGEAFDVDVTADATRTDI